MEDIRSHLDKVVYVKLRDYSNRKEFKTFSDVRENFLQKMTSEEMNKRILFILDGYDELNHNEFNWSRDILELDKHKNFRVIITCRTNYYSISDL